MKDLREKIIEILKKHSTALDEMSDGIFEPVENEDLIKDLEELSAEEKDKARIQQLQVDTQYLNQERQKWVEEIEKMKNPCEPKTNDLEDIRKTAGMNTIYNQAIEDI